MAIKKPTSKFWFWISYFFSALAVFCIAVGFFESAKKNYLFFYADNELEYYRTVSEYYGKLSEFISKQLLTDDVKAIIARADKSKSSSEQNLLRRQLYALLEQKYAELKKIDFDIISFSLTDHTVFLDFDGKRKFEEYLDARQLKPKIDLCDDVNCREPFFVCCEHDYALIRGFAIHYQAREIGRLELGISMKAIKRMFRLKFGGRYGFMPYMPLSSSCSEQDNFQTKFVMLPGVSKYWIEKQFLAANMLLPRIKGVLVKRLAAGKPFCLYRNDDTFTFVPVKDCSGLISGWIVHTDVNRKMVTLHWIFLVSLCGAEIVLLIIFFYINRLRYIRSKLEESIQAAEAVNEAKSTFLSSIHHEIRTPLIGVLGMSDMLKETNPSVLQNEYIQIIRESGDALLHTLNDIVELTRLEADEGLPQAAETDLRELIDVCFNLLRFEAEKKKLKFYYEIEAAVPTIIIADQARIRQILLILVSNVIKFTSSGEVKLNVAANIIPDTDKIELTFATSDVGESGGNLETVADIFAGKIL
ncbi:MAG: histidine kinase dimerization/phospho-acceptor domain-containing protein, partial [Victivallaceae bacterium]